MKVLRRFFAHTQPQVSTSRFNTYYAHLLQQGDGYPTADEARRDLKNFDLSMKLYGWPR